ncbi:unnamed protein product [Phytophthora lilii]|uniref:Unnamed protein product n=1 Tax=Phytophthora lilii TaxID=2077276 RepID=A0A9W6TV90_9STRA|nr:unnamed protein product [Phytophthora lilii]
MPNRQRIESIAVSSDVSPRKQVATPSTARAGGGPRVSILQPKLNAMQTAELLKPFWGDLLQNNLKNVRKFLRENRSRIDFNTARYTPCADGTGLHLCAQHGFIACAKLLLDIGVMINLQNKVGSTALHVACKFNQEEMVMFLLETGARMDIPDMRNNVAFDVAPYSLLDKCMLAPQRAKLAAEQDEEARLLEVHEAAERQFEEVTLAKAYASMLLIDWESHAWEEWQMLQATNKVDREWSEQVQRSKDTLEVKRAMYTDLQVLLQKEQNQIALTWRNIFRDAQNRKERAREELEQMLMLTEETHQHWMHEQQELWDQCGLLEAAEEFPNDADVQQWVLHTIIAMIDEAELGSVPINPHQDFVTTDINELLVREEIVLLINNVLLRFPKMRDLQYNALQCLVKLVRHCKKTSLDAHTSSFLKTLVKANVLANSRDVLSYFDEDVELAHLVIELLYHLLQFRGENGAHSLQFCQNRFSHQIPLRILRLHDAVVARQDDVEPSQTQRFTPTVMLYANHHIAFLLFTLTKYNVRKALDNDGAVPLVRSLIFQFTSNPFGHDTSTDEIKVSALRYLLATLTLLYSPHPPQNCISKRSPRPGLPSSWSVNEISEVLSAVQPWLSTSSASISTNRPLANAYRSLAFWMIKLLRNVTQPLQNEIVQLRTWLRTREMFEFFAGVTLAIRGCKLEVDDDSAVQNIVVVWLELVEDVWLCRFNSDGQLAATAPFVLEFLLQMLELEAHMAEPQGYNVTFINIAAVLKLIAQVLANLHGILNQLLDAKLDTSNHDSGMELLAYILRVYLRFFDYERNHSKSGTNLHERCRAIGICTALQAFRLLNDISSSEAARSTPPISNANQSNDNAAEPESSSKLKAKMQLARTWSRLTAEQNLHGPKRDALSSLACALLRHAPCHCFDN